MILSGLLCNGTASSLFPFKTLLCTFASLRLIIIGERISLGQES
jgi:hypothetical protein